MAVVQSAQAQEGKSMPAPIVFFDIAGPDLASQKAFYKAVLGIETDQMGQFQAPAIGPSIPALLRTDPAETVVYFGVESINATMEKVVANGGKVHAPRFVVPGVVILGLANDPAGNRFGLVEMKDGKPIVP
jgi:predicted enzyme related to lactoylglutathione lyase